jgi:SAM-dependent methyltransferase
MTTDHEVRRLSKVYQDYQESNVVQAQWAETNYGNRAIQQERRDNLQALLKTSGYWPPNRYQILDIGCGVGQILASFLDWGAQPQNLYGVDLLPDRIVSAQKLFPHLHFEQANAENLQFGDATFDLILLFTVFTSILDERMAHNIANGINRILKPGGAIVWYDFRYNNPRNPHVRGIDRTQIQRLFPAFELQLRTITLLPPLARRLGPLTSIFYPLLARIPFLRTHYLGLLVKPC